LGRRHKDPYTQEKLRLVGDQLSRIQRTLRELVDFSRPAVRQRTWTPVHEAVEAALSIAKYYKRTEGKSIETDFDPAVPPIRTTRDQLIQVLLNLVLNAIDATGKAGHIRIETRLEGERIAVRICDDGHGITRDQLERIFQPYFTTKEHGTGLGLFVSRKILAEMGGRLRLESTSPEGTTFVVELPLAEVADTVEASADGASSLDTEALATG
jgi:signal transduction histidine kinase